MAIPIWSEATVIADRVLQKGSVARQTFDLRTKFGAQVMVSIGRSGSVAFSNGIDVLIRRTLGGDTLAFPTPAAGFRTAQGASIASQQLSSAYTAGVTAMNINAVGNFAADDLICFWGTTTNPNTFTDSTDVTGKLEFARITKIAAGPPVVLTVDAPTKLSRLANEYVTD